MVDSVSKTLIPEPTTGSVRPQPKPHRLLTATAFVLATGAALFVGAEIGARRHARSAESTTTAAPGAMPDMPGMAGSSMPPPPPGAGSNAAYVSAARQQLVGVRTGVVERQRVEGTIRTVGVLAYDETRVAQIHTRVNGWVEQLFVDYVGKPVRRGQPLFSVYSPDLVTAENDYLIALRMRRQLGDGAMPDAKEGADALLTASRERLRRWEVTQSQIDALERTGQVSRTVTLVSPFDGVVLEKNAFAGQYVTPDMTSFKLADLSTIWVIGQVFEFEASRIHAGDSIDVEFPYGQAPRALKAQVDFVYPEVDPQTRRVRFRAVMKNADKKLKPDTYVSLVLHGEAVDRLVVPREAVLDNGERKYVLLAHADGYFEPRTIEVGPPLGDFYPVASGVAEGDRVVTSAQFLIDSETNLMAAMKNMAMSMPGMDMGAKPAPSTGTPPAPSAMPPSMPGMSNMPGMPMPPAMHSIAPPPPSHAASSAPPPKPSAQPPKPSAQPPMPSMSSMPGMPQMHDHSGMKMP